jgi:hypothetical protein
MCIFTSQYNVTFFKKNHQLDILDSCVEKKLCESRETTNQRK